MTWGDLERFPSAAAGESARPPGRLLVHFPMFKTSGAALSVIKLISTLADGGWQLTVLVSEGGGELERSIDPRVRTMFLRNAQPIVVPGRDKASRWDRARVALRGATLLGTPYDAAFSTFFGYGHVLRRFVRARTFVQWVREDVRRFPDDHPWIRDMNVTSRTFDRIVCVSESSREAFLERFPHARPRTDVIYDVVDLDGMRSRAESPGASLPDVPPGTLRILTVCRISDATKALHRAVHVASLLKRSGHAFRWYVIGDGEDWDAVQSSIAEADVGDRFVMLGHADNPLPAYRQADVVAMVSYSEALSGVVNEARALGRPVLATKVPGLHEQIEHGVDGWIVEQSASAIADGLARLLTDATLRRDLARGGLRPAIADDRAKRTSIERMIHDTRRRYASVLWSNPWSNPHRW